MRRQFTSPFLALAILSTCLNVPPASSHVATQTTNWRAYATLHSRQGRRYGVAATFQHHVLVAGDESTVSGRGPWQQTAFYSATMGVSDDGEHTFHDATRTERPALRSAEERAGEPFSIRVESWSLREHAAPHWRAERIDAQFDDGTTAIVLHMQPVRPSVILNAPTVQAWTRLTARGTIMLDGVRYPVSGIAWIDRESFLGSAVDIDGCDRFMIQLDDGRDLLIRRVRGRRGGPVQSGGVLVDEHGRATPIAAADFMLENPLGTRWKSERTATIYPALWQLTLAHRSLDLAVIEPFHEQEIDGGAYGHSFVDATVDVERASPPGGTPGTGFVELTGYDWPLRVQRSR